MPCVCAQSRPATTAAPRLDRRPPRPQRERQEDRRQDEADRQDDVRDEQDREVRTASRPIVGAGGPVQRRRGRASSATQSPSVSPARDAQAGGLERRRGPRPRGRRRCPTRGACRPAGARRARAGASGTSSPAMRLASTTSNAGSPLGRLPEARPKPPHEPVAAGVGGRRLDGDRVGVDAERRGRAEPDRGDRQDPRAAADVEDARAGEHAAVGERLEAARHRRVVGWSPVPNAIPGSSARTTSSGSRRWRRQVGRMTSRRPTRRTGKYAFQASAQSASWTTRVRSSPIGRRPNAWRWPSASATSAAARSAAARSRAGT